MLPESLFPKILEIRADCLVYTNCKKWQTKSFRVKAQSRRDAHTKVIKKPKQKKNNYEYVFQYMCYEFVWLASLAKTCLNLLNNLAVVTALQLKNTRKVTFGEATMKRSK